MKRLGKALVLSIPMAVMLIAIPFIHAQNDLNKLYVHYEGYFKPTSGGGADAVFWFVEDKETGTRCYAFRADFHDGAAIACVPKGK